VTWVHLAAASPHLGSLGCRFATPKFTQMRICRTQTHSGMDLWTWVYLRAYQSTKWTQVHSGVAITTCTMCTCQDYLYQAYKCLGWVYVHGSIVSTYICG
jgi:hypothetical protein